MKNKTVPANVAVRFSEEQATKDLIEAAFLGMCKHDLGATKPTLQFGLINTRPLDENAVRALRSKFLSQGVRRNDPDTVIHVGVDASLINVAELSKTTLPMSGYKTLQEIFKPTIPTRQQIVYPYSGQHRVEAMKTFEEQILTPKEDATAKEIVRLTKKVAELENTELTEGAVAAEEVKEILPQTKALLEQQQDLLARIQGLIDEERDWTLKLYDRSKPC